MQTATRTARTHRTHHVGSSQRGTQARDAETAAPGESNSGWDGAKTYGTGASGSMVGGVGQRQHHMQGDTKREWHTEGGGVWDRGRGAREVITLTSQLFDRVGQNKNYATVLVFEVLRRTISKAFCSSSCQGGLPFLLHCAAQVAHIHNCLVIPRKKYSPRWATKALPLRSEAVPLSPSPEAHCRTAARSARSGAAEDHSGPPTLVLGRLRHTKRGRRDGWQRRLRAAHHCPDFWVVDCNNSAREARPACKGGTGAHLAATRTGGDASRLDS